ncbi:hypothetical protein [Kiloniella laminariae]|uniref:hypothetical protein n=1 Tax=Kiloniella laminariae TaxID=454162 RepID=UPI00036CEC0D|nr:hypothetical protein [Kiloniella laminariae]
MGYSSLYLDGKPLFSTGGIDLSTAARRSQSDEPERLRLTAGDLLDHDGDSIPLLDAGELGDLLSGDLSFSLA